MTEIADNLENHLKLPIYHSSRNTGLIDGKWSQFNSYRTFPPTLDTQTCALYI